MLLPACDESTTKASGKTAPVVTRTEPKRDQDIAPLPAERSGGPMMHMLRTSVDFGKISDMDELTAEIAFINNGDRVLEVERIQPTCGCTTTQLERKLFGPGEGDVIELTYKPKTAGKQTKVVKVYTNDSINPVQTISIIADVSGSVSVDPKSLSFGTVTLGSGAVGSVTLKSENQTYKPGNPKVFGQLKEHASVHVTETTRSGDKLPSWQVDVVLDPGIPWGWHTGSLQIPGTLKKPGETKVSNKSMTVGMNASIEGSIRASDTVFRLLLMEQNRPISKTIQLSHADGKPFQILETTVTNNPRPTNLAVAVVPIEGTRGAGYELTLTGNTGTMYGPIRGDIEVKTDVPGEENITLRVVGSVRNPDV